VIAAPIDNFKQLLGLQSTKRSASAHMFQVVGTLREQYNHAHLNLFPDDDPTVAIARQAKGSILFCSRESDPDFKRANIRMLPSTSSAINSWNLNGYPTCT